MNDTSLLALVANASIPVQLVLVILLFASIFSWALMYVKSGYIKQGQAEATTY